MKERIFLYTEKDLLTMLFCEEALISSVSLCSVFTFIVKKSK